MYEFTIETTSDIELKITFYRPDLFRIQAAPDGDYADPKNDPAKAQIDLGDGNENDHADWIDVKLVRKGSE